jgi:hypothetical protein
MAFNPFHAFRKHQKTLLAGVTILAMVTFILSTGSLSGGDFFGELLRLIGAQTRMSGVGTLYGREVSHHELALVRHQRQIAHEYMSLAGDTAFQNVFQELRTLLEKNKPLMEELQRALLFASIPEFQGQSLSQLSMVRTRLQAEGKTHEAQLTGQLLGLFSQRLLRAQRPNELYFGGQLERTEDLLDFLIWRHKADELGIQLTTADVRSEIERETLGQLTQDNMRSLQNRLRRDQQSLQMLPNALADEFRVRLAQAALLGEHPGGATRVPAPVTPYEFWEFYRKNRTEVSATLLPIPVQDFVAKVEEKPTEEELKTLFEKHKTQESTPESPTPGFKQPRRVQVEWVAVQPDSPHYRKATEAAAAALQAAWPGAWNANLLDEYQGVKFQFRLPPLTEPSFALSIYSSLGRPADVAAAFGKAAAPLGPTGSALSAAISFQGSTILREAKTLASVLADEVKKRLPGAATQFLTWSGAAAIPGFGTPLTTLVDPLATLAGSYGEPRKDQFLPFEVVKDKVVERVQENLRRELVSSALATVRKEVENRRTRPEEARKYLEEAIPRYGLKHGSMDRPRDRYDIAGAAALAPLKEAYLRPPAADPKGKDFANLFFRQGNKYTPERWPSEGLRSPGDETVFLYWRTEDTPARVPEFNEVKEQVAGAWRFHKARALAKAKANEVEQTVRKQAGDVLPTFKEIGDKHSWKPFDLYGVARLQSKPSALFGPKQYEPYRVPDDKIEYPSADFVDRLQGLQAKGDVTVVHDRPERTYYVAALTQNPTKPTPLSFFFVYQDAGGGALRTPDPLLSLREQELRREYYRAFMDELRAQAGLSISEDARKADQAASTGLD